MKVVVLGGGESGYGSAVLAQVKGLEVFLSDKGTIAPKYAEILDRYGIPYVRAFLLYPFRAFSLL